MEEDINNDIKKIKLSLQYHIDKYIQQHCIQTDNEYEKETINTILREKYIKKHKLLSSTSHPYTQDIQTITKTLQSYHPNIDISLHTTDVVSSDTNTSTTTSAIINNNNNSTINSNKIISKKKNDDNDNDKDKEIYELTKLQKSLPTSITNTKLLYIATNFIVKYIILNECQKQLLLKYLENHIIKLKYNKNQYTKINIPKLKNESCELFHCFMATPRISDLYTLYPSCWQNDEIINGYLYLLLQRVKRYNIIEYIEKCDIYNTIDDTNVIVSYTHNLYPRSLRIKLHIFSTHFFYKMWDPIKEKFIYEYNYVKKWSKRQNIIISNLDKLIIPVHISGNHWTLSCINFIKKRFEYYDNLRGSDRGILYCLRNYLRDEIITYNNNSVINIDEWIDFIDPNIPLQKNGYDCGVFILYMARLLCTNTSMYYQDSSSNEILPSFTQDDITNFRIIIGQNLISGSLI